MSPQTHDIESIFRRIVFGQTVVISFAAQRNFESLRASLLRKFKNYRKEIVDLGGDDPHPDQFLKASFDSSLVKGTFRLALLHEKKNQPGRTYTVEEL